MKKKKSVSDPVGWEKKLNPDSHNIFFCQKLQFCYFLR